MLQSAINVSEGTNRSVLDLLANAAGATLVDRHSDVSHNRSVFTLLGDDSDVLAGACRVTEAALSLLDVSTHQGVHPRFGAIDVVPFVPFIDGRDRTTPVDFSAAHDVAASYRAFAEAHGATTARYGIGERSLPELRKCLASGDLQGIVSGQVHPSHGITAVGVRDVLVAWNMWVDGVDLGGLRVVAKQLRSAALRTLALQLGDGQLQLSCNIVLPFEISLTEIVQAARECLEPHGRVTGGELVGLLPADLLNRSPKDQWEFLGVAEMKSLEWNASVKRR